MSEAEVTPTPAVEPDVWAEAPEVAEEVALEAEADGEEFAEDSFEPAAPEAEQKSVTVPLRRLSKVIRQRNDLRDALSETEATVARLNGQLQSRGGITEVVEKRYGGNTKLLDFDATFMETFDREAKKDPTLSAAAAKVRAAMTGAPINVSNEQTAEAAPVQTDPAVTALLHSNTTSAIVAALTEQGVKPSFARMVAKDVIREVPVEELPEWSTPAAAVRAAKVFFKDEGISAEDFLAAKPAAGKAKPPAVSGKAKPAASPKPGAKGAVVASADGKPEIKTLDELHKHREGRFAEIVEGLTNA